MFTRSSFFLILLFSSHIFICSVSKASYRVILDPGHGGSDTGVKRDSFIESQIVLSIAEKIKTQLDQINSTSSEKIDVTLTRQTDSNLSLQQRVDEANRLNADLFISLHANSSSSSSVSGFEFYFASQIQNRAEEKNKNLNSADIVNKIKNDLLVLGKQKRSLELSKIIQDENLDKKSVIRRAPFYVIENTNMPSILIEVGFITNRREAKKLATPEYQTEIANRLTKSILNYKEKSDKKVSIIEN